MFKLCRVILLSFIVCFGYMYGQSPVAIKIGSEQGIPNQTAYSIIQDHKGFIWLGTDGGLFRFDGIRYKLYNSTAQKSRSITGLTENSKGEIFAYNFSGQIFHVKHDSLMPLDSWSKEPVSNICIDKQDNLWVCYNHGLKSYSSISGKWARYDCASKNSTQNFTHSCYTDTQDNIWCFGPQGLVKIHQTQEKLYNFPFEEKRVSGEYMLTYNSPSRFIFSRIGGEVYYMPHDSIINYKSEVLSQALTGKKITRTQEQNGIIWIYTYSGIVIYNIAKNTCSVIYPDIAFSGGTIDLENTYWLSTLHDGIYKVPDLEFKYWEIADDKSINTKIHKLVCAGNSVYFATVDGRIGKLNHENHSTDLITLVTKLDIQSLKPTEDKQHALFSIQNTIYKTENNKAIVISENHPPTKDILQINDYYIIATSKGSLWFHKTSVHHPDTLTKEWTRSIAYDGKEILWLATNDGVKQFKALHNKWKHITDVLPQTQIISICYSATQDKLYILSFDGNIYEISQQGSEIKKLFSLPNSTSGYQLKCASAKIYVATNKGLIIYHTDTKTTTTMNRLSGLMSNNIYSIDIDSSSVWLATANGIGQIPLAISDKKTVSKIYLKDIIVNQQSQLGNKKLTLNYNDKLIIEPEAASLSSENQYQYAYRINHNQWFYLPAEIDKIEIPYSNPGNFELEIKLINHMGKDSENVLVINGYVNPPFWQRWWFYILIVVSCSFLTYFILKQRIKSIRKKQQKEVERLKLEHELRLSKETALRAQMNPHFIFNVLNSIKGYIYENDKKKAAGYLQSFSDLVRKILEQSSVSWVKLDEELELLKLYIELESMMLSEEFEYRIRTNNIVDSDNISIPSLMLQPFIENAFKHGLRHKTGKKHLFIELTKEAELLIISITDNGIGRSEAEKINAEKDTKHKSFSTGAIHKITNINQDMPGIVAISYVDLKDENGHSRGTTVTINIRYHE